MVMGGCRGGGGGGVVARDPRAYDAYIYIYIFFSFLLDECSLGPLADKSTEQFAVSVCQRSLLLFSV